MICFGSVKVLAEENKFYGFWQYKVKVGHTALFNPNYFAKPIFSFSPLDLPEEPITSTDKEIFVGKQEVQLKDIYYTGYFKLGSHSADNVEVMGNYYPAKFANTYDQMPLQISKTYKKADGKIRLFWKADLSKRNIEQIPVLWFSEAEYNPETDIIKGITLALDCSSKPCTQINIAKWEANRIANINYYNKQNYYTKGIISRFLQNFDKSGSLARKLLKEEFGLEEYKFLSQKYSKIPLQAVLKAKAYEPANEDYELSLICRLGEDYCLNNYALWPGTTDQARVNACQAATQARASMCCGNNGLPNPNAGCRCLVQKNCQTPNCIVCCQALTTCTKTVKYTIQGKGSYKNGSGDGRNTVNNLALQGIQAARAIQQHGYVQNIINNFAGSHPIPHFTDLNVEYIYGAGDNNKLPPDNPEGTGIF